MSAMALSLPANGSSFSYVSMCQDACQDAQPMNDSLVDELDTLLREGRLTPMFQPIVAAETRTMFGYEALIRGPADSALHSPLVLFGTAQQAGRLVELDLLCACRAIEAFRRQALPGRLFLNVMPSSLLQTDAWGGAILGALDAAGLPPERVVIELTEHLPIHDYPLMRHAVDHYRERGLRVALDDLGAGYAGLRHWTELRPDFVKVDRHFIQDLDRDPGKRQVLGSLLEIAQGLGCRVIAEGIETAGEQRCLRDLGCPLLQGYHLARPFPEPPRQLDVDEAEPARTAAGALGPSAAMLCNHLAPVAQGTPVPEVLERFRAEPGLRCLPVLEAGGRPVGVVRQRDLLSRFANPFSHSLYARRSIETLMDTRMLVVEDSLFLETLSTRITGATEGLQEDFVIVDEAGRYRGMGNVVDLLREITALKVRSARQANPLTGLPGNQSIHRALAARLESGQSFAAVYCDLDNFKAYNDLYGYAQGDQVILAVSRLLEEQCRGDDFVGHVGGDDFMLVLAPDTARQQCDAILTHFAGFAPTFYRDEHRRAGGIRVPNRRGERVFFPLMSLSIALCPVPAGTGGSALDIANVLAELKQQAKKQPGNSLFVERRQ